MKKPIFDFLIRSRLFLKERLSSASSRISVSQQIWWIHVVVGPPRLSTPPVGTQPDTILSFATARSEGSGLQWHHRAIGESGKVTNKPSLRLRTMDEAKSIRCDVRRMYFILGDVIELFAERFKSAVWDRWMLISTLFTSSLLWTDLHSIETDPN